MTADLDRINSRFPFPLLDEVWIDDDGHGRKYVSGGEVYFSGHFPNEPILPGVLIIGAFTAIASLLVDGGGGIVHRISRLRFHQPVRPGDVLDFVVRRVECGDGGAWFQGEATVDGQLAARGTFQL